jgi:hypothetical protein
MTALNDLIPPGSGWTLWYATAINNGGQIVGFGFHNDQLRAYLLTPDSRAVSAPTSAVADTPFAVPVTARDASGNVDTGYTGTVHFTGTDPQAVLPEAYTFTATDAGVHSFPGGATLYTAGTVHFLKASIDIRVLAGLITRAGGEVVSADDY